MDFFSIPFFGTAADRRVEFYPVGLLSTSCRQTSANFRDLHWLSNSILLLDFDLSLLDMSRESRRDVLFVEGVRRVVRDIN